MVRSLLAAALFLVPAGAFAMSDAEFANALRPVLAASADGRYKLIEKKANQTMDILKTLRDYARDVKKASESLRDEMKDNSYED